MAVKISVGAQMTRALLDCANLTSYIQDETVF